MGFSIISRVEWGSLPSKWRTIGLRSVRYVLCGYTYTRTCDDVDTCTRELRSLQTHQIKKTSCPDIRYNFLVGGAGLVFEGRGWGAAPGLPRDYKDLNRRSLYIGYICNFIGSEGPTTDMIKTCNDLIQFGVDNKHIPQDFTRQNVYEKHYGSVI